MRGVPAEESQGRYADAPCLDSQVCMTGLTVTQKVRSRTAGLQKVQAVKMAVPRIQGPCDCHVP